MGERPAVGLDVDGVLMPWMRAEYGTWLLALADRCDLVWATSWEHAANWHVGPRLGLPELPVIEFPGLVKLPSVAAWCAGRPMAWLDDWFSPQTYVWAGARNGQGVATLLVAVDPAEGLRSRHCDTVSAWLDRLTSTPR